MSDGAIVECAIETLEAAVGAARADSPRRSPPQRSPQSRTVAVPPFAPRRRRLSAALAALALAAVAVSGAGSYAWFASGSTSPRAAGLPAPSVAPPVVVGPPHPPGADVLADGVPAGVAGAPQIAAAVSSPAAPLPAFVAFDVPFEVRIYENGGFVGTNAERIRVPPGRHTFTLVNAVLGFRAERTVLAAAGRSTPRVIGQPSAPLSVMAEPWAEVFLDGRSLGQTPIASISLPVGIHQLTLRHPVLGERQVAMTVRLGAPNRLWVDMRR